MKLNWYCEHDDVSTLESTYYCSRYEDQYTPSELGLKLQNEMFSFQISSVVLKEYQGIEEMFFFELISKGFETFFSLLLPLTFSLNQLESRQPVEMLPSYSKKKPYK